MVLIAVFALGDGLPDILSLSSQELARLICIVGMCLGAIAGFWRSWLGSVLIISSVATFIFLNGALSLPSFIILFLIDGILYMASACCRA